MSAQKTRTCKTSRANGEWMKVKRKGSKHYHGGGLEPIDLMRAGGLLYPFAISCIMKYAYRNRKANRLVSVIKEDMDKIIHYAEMVKVIAREEAARHGVVSTQTETTGIINFINPPKGEETDAHKSGT